MNHTDTIPRSVAAGDFNGDTRLDIAVAYSGSDHIGIFLAFQNQTFGNQNVYSTGLGSRPRSIVVTDFDNDHQLDIVVANYGTNSIGILYGNQHGSFDIPINYGTGFDSLPSFVAVADLNNDSHLDIVVANAGTNSVGIFLGYGNGNLSEQHLYHMDPQSRPCAIAIADFNHDHRPDLAIAQDGNRSVAILLAN